MALLLLMLCSGLFQVVSSNHLRLIIKCGNSISRTEACKKCKVANGKLLSLYDQKDANFTKWKLSKESPNQIFWLGLRKSQCKLVTWSNGDRFTTQLLEEADSQHQQCGAIANNEWKLFSCSESRYFMCSNGAGHVLIKKEKNWCQAQWYCRKYYSDLISIDGVIPQDVIETGGKETFWTGLLMDPWHSKDGQCSTYRDWDTINELQPYAAMTKSGMKTLGFMDVAGVLCSKGYHRVKLIEKRKTWEEAINYCKQNYVEMLWIEDEEDQKAVEDEINYTYESLGKKVEGPFWIATRQSSIIGLWIWRDRFVSYSNWIDDRMPTIPLSYECGAIDPDRDFKWSDANCSRKLHFLCEEGITS